MGVGFEAVVGGNYEELLNVETRLNARPRAAAAPGAGAMAQPLMQKRMEDEAKQFQTMQKEHTKMGQAFSKLMAQHNENEMVLKELKMLEDDAKVFKLVGPVLLSQDLDEAKSTVEKRLQYIGDEMKRTQNHLNDLEGRCEEKKSKIMQLQAQLRKGAAKPEGAPAAAQ